MGRRHALTFALAVLLAAAPAAAQTVYKLIDRNGKVTYSEEPPKDFDGRVIRIDIDPNANKATLGVPPPQAAPREAPAGDRGQPKGKEARKEPSAEERLGQARDRLDAARKALEDAKEHPGEGDIQWMGKVGGGARPVPSEAYQQRLAGLERAVKEAEHEVEELEKQR